MPTRILDHRETDLGARFEHLQDAISKVDDHPIKGKFEERFGEINDSFSEIETRRFDVESNQDDDALYQRYLKKLLDTEADLEELEVVLTHVDLFSHHRDIVSERVNRTEAICEELDQSFGLDATFLPVNAEDYALLPLLDSEFYVIYLPRGVDIVPTMPILAHEVAHAILDQDHVRSADFNRRFSELRRNMGSDRTERDFYENWSQWYSELFCDVAGFFAFGPSYIYSQLHHLVSRRPFHIQRDVGIQDDFLHPPNALRIEIVARLADNHLPSDLLAPLDPYREEYSAHLERYRDSKPSFYDSWTDDRMIDAVIEDGKSVDNRFELLCDHLIDGTKSSAAPDFEYRIKANRFWSDEN